LLLAHVLVREHFAHAQGDVRKARQIHLAARQLAGELLHEGERTGVAGTAVGLGRGSLHRRSRILTAHPDRWGDLCPGLHHGSRFSRLISIESARERILPAMASMPTTCRAAPRDTASPGMPQTTLLASSWATVWLPDSSISFSPRAP